MINPSLARSTTNSRNTSDGHASNTNQRSALTTQKPNMQEGMAHSDYGEERPEGITQQDPSDVPCYTPSNHGETASRAVVWKKVSAHVLHKQPPTTTGSSLNFDLKRHPGLTHTSSCRKIYRTTNFIFFC